MNDQHEHSAGALVCGICGGKISALARGEGLPYSWWKLEEPAEIAPGGLSVSALARDSRTGQVYSVREYFPQSERELSLREDVQLHNFVNAAKALRKVAVASMTVLFPYTAASRWYTVSAKIAGSSLEAGDGKGPYSEAEVSKWLRAMLVALDAIHTETIPTGPLYHGDVRLANVRVEEAGYRVHIANPAYLEQFLTETRLPPEHFVEQDLRGAALSALEMLDGKQHQGGDQSPRLDAIKGLALGTTLDYLLRPAGQRPGSAQHLLTFLDDIGRAEAPGPSAASTAEFRELYKAAYALSGSPRLLPILKAFPVTPQRQPSGPTPPGAVPSAPAPASRAPLPASSVAPAPPPVPPPGPPYPPRPSPSAQRPSGPAPAPAAAPPVAPLPPAFPGVPSPAKRATFADRLVQFVRTAILMVTIGVAALVIAVALLIRSFFAGDAPKPPRIVAEPAVIYRGQSSLLHWTAQGYSHVEVNGHPVKASDSRPVSPPASTSYRLTVKDSGGKIQSVDTTVVVVAPPRALRKPKPGQEAAPGTE